MAEETALAVTPEEVAHDLVAAFEGNSEELMSAVAEALRAERRRGAAEEREAAIKAMRKK
jgi:hypothetical protein